MPTKRGWITPDSIPAATRCRVLLIPDDDIIYANVSGALLDLIYPNNYEQVGLVSPDALASAMATMYDAFLVSNCEGAGSVEVASYLYTQPSGTAGGAWVQNTDQNLVWNTAEREQPWLEFNSPNYFRFDDGIYTIELWQNVVQSSGYAFIAFRDNGQTYSFCPTAQMAVDRWCHWSFTVNLTGNQQRWFYVRSNAAAAANNLGAPKSLAGVIEQYGRVNFYRHGAIP